MESVLCVVELRCWNQSWSCHMQSVVSLYLMGATGYIHNAQTGQWDPNSKRLPWAPWRVNPAPAVINSQQVVWPHFRDFPCYSDLVLVSSSFLCPPDPPTSPLSSSCTVQSRQSTVNETFHSVSVSHLCVKPTGGKIASTSAIYKKALPNSFTLTQMHLIFL